MDRLAWLRKTLENSDINLMREVPRVFAEELVGADADAIKIKIPKTHESSYLPSLIEPRRRIDRAMLSVIQ